MSKKSTLLGCAALLCCLFAGNRLHAQINAQFLGRYSTGSFDKTAAEIAAYDPGTKRMFVINAADTSLRIVNISDPSNPTLVSSVSIKPYGIDLTSVACNRGRVAVNVIDSTGKTADCKVVFFDVNGNFVNQVRVGANPDMLCFTPDGKKLLVANEGEPNSDYTIDRPGTVSIIDLTPGVANITNSNVTSVDFTAFDSVALDPRIKITGKIQSGGSFLRNSKVSEDLEPEYITISDDNSTAYVTLQENNALAIIDINTATVTSLVALGFKNHSATGNGLDASNQGSTIRIKTQPVFGMYQPDAIAHYKVGDQGYLVTANEGDVRADWGSANNEEADVRSSSYVLDTSKFGGSSAAIATIKSDTGIGRLKVTSKYGDFNGDGKFDSAFCFGGRSFSIWNASTGALVWDSKDQFEQFFANNSTYAPYFNTNNTANSLKNRSDDKGVEPEAAAVGKILDSTYAFIGLERMGGIMIYNITDPGAPYFVQYITTRNFAVTPSQANIATVGDLGPEGITFIPRHQSPNGKDMLMVSNEISGTVALYQISSRSAYQMQLLHASDMESGLDAVHDAPNFAAILDTLEHAYPNTLKLASGDCYIPGPFLACGEDASLQTPLRNTASSYYAGTTSQLRAAIGRVDIAMMNIMGFQGSAFGNHEFDLGTSEVNSIIGVDIRSGGSDKRWIGAQFPYLSANLDFSADANLSYLVTGQRLPDTAFKTSPSITSNNEKKGIAPSAYIVSGGEKIGIVGATTQLLESISSPGNTKVKGVKQDDMAALAAILQPVIDSLRIAEGINKIIVLSHLQQLSNEIALAPLLKGVDIIVAGGSHNLIADGNDRLRAGNTATNTYPIKTTNNDGDPLLIVNSTAEWKYVNRLVCDFDADGKILLSSLDSNINGVYATDSAMVTELYGTYAAGFSTGSKGANVRTLCSAVGTAITNKDGNLFGKTDVFLEGRRHLVRTEETNLGNLSADANLAIAKIADPAVQVSIKNGGGIRSAIGEVFAVGSSTTLLPPAPNAAAGKARGDISQLDIENSLRFNNLLSLVSLKAKDLKKILEHGVNATAPGATPGQFPQVGGIRFSYNYASASGSKIKNAVIIDSLGNYLDTLVLNGAVYGDTDRVIRVVTLNFLAGGGDSYPFNTYGFDRVDLNTDSTIITAPGAANFAIPGSEQDAFAEYMISRYSVTPYNKSDKAITHDQRIEQINSRADDLFTKCANGKRPGTKSIAPHDTLFGCVNKIIPTRNAGLYPSRLWSTGDTAIQTKVTTSGWVTLHEYSSSFCNYDSVYVHISRDVIPATLDTVMCDVPVGDTISISLNEAYNTTGLGSFIHFLDSNSNEITQVQFSMDANSDMPVFNNYVSFGDNSLKCPAKFRVYAGLKYDRLFTFDTLRTTTAIPQLRPDISRKYYGKNLWSTGDSGAFIYPKTSGIYWLEKRTSKGCTIRDTVHVSILRAKIASKKQVCPGEDFVMKVDSGNTNSTVIWSNGDTAFSTVYNFSSPDTIWMIQQDAYFQVIDSTIISIKTNCPPSSPIAASAGQVNKKGITVYPNPTNGRIVIDNNGEYQHYEIIDLIGRSLLKGSLQSTSTEVDLSGLEAGTYVLMLHNEATAIQVKLVKVD